MNNEPFCSYKADMVARYGAPLFRVPLDLGFGCPHRCPDGGGGCSYCPEDGARVSFTEPDMPIEEQIRVGIHRVARLYGADHYLAYIQAYTGTYAPVDTLRERYERILAAHPFPAMAIGTRPDCLEPDVLALLEGLTARTDVWVELGVQSVHDDTLARINRGHTWQQSREAIEALAARGIRVAVHVILGLPGETEAHFAATAEALSRAPIAGIKIHNLHVIEGTPLAEEYRKEPFAVYDEQAYTEILTGFLRRLRADIPIIRICTDTVGRGLIAPQWNVRKARFRHDLICAMNANGWRQGDLCG